MVSAGSSIGSGFGFGFGSGGLLVYSGLASEICTIGSGFGFDRRILGGGGGREEIWGIGDPGSNKEDGMRDASISDT